MERQVAETYVGWQWKAGGTSSSNTNGSITSTVSVNATAGFSVVTYTGTGANATVGHGLGVAPSMVIVKTRSVGTYDWCVYHSSLTTASYYFHLNGTRCSNSLQHNVWNQLRQHHLYFLLALQSQPIKAAKHWSPTACHAVAGYSAFGSYTGNGSTDGPFVFTGFQTTLVMVKAYR